MRFPNVKVGDTVRVLVKARYGFLEAGTVDVVTAVNNDGSVEVGTGRANTFYGMCGGELELVTTAYPNAPHKHAKLIKAWADGAEIEFAGNSYGWHTAVSPLWLITREYRIKPMVPVKSDKDIQIEKLEQQAIDLAAAISKLKA